MPEETNQYDKHQPRFAHLLQRENEGVAVNWESVFNRARFFDDLQIERAEAGWTAADTEALIGELRARRRAEHDARMRELESLRRNGGMDDLGR